MTNVKHAANSADAFVVDAVEPNTRPRLGASVASIGVDLRLSITRLESYFFAQWQSELVDLLVVAAAVEYCDIVKRRPNLGWARAFDVRVAVHDPQKWNSALVRSALEETLNFLTGDVWAFSFDARGAAMQPVPQRSLDLDTGARAIVPYSDGLDSRAVAALIEHEEHGGLVRVRLGAGGMDRSRGRRRVPFTTVPYEVHIPKRLRRESTARSRGFKFAVITGIAARLANINRVVVTESGQGALGPVIAVTGHAYPDYRVHPSFTNRIERLFEVLTGARIHYEFPRIWSTKGETISDASRLSPGPTWHDTRSCWQGSRQVSVAGSRRQCGICAACLLRRMSMHAAGLVEASDVYIWESLSVSEMREGATAGFTAFTPALEQYAIAGILHLDHLAALARSPLHIRRLRQAAREIALALGQDARAVEEKLVGLLERHRSEWLAFLNLLGPKSFVANLASVEA